MVAKQHNKQKNIGNLDANGYCTVVIWSEPDGNEPRLLIVFRNDCFNNVH